MTFPDSRNTGNIGGVMRPLCLATWTFQIIQNYLYKLSGKRLSGKRLVWEIIDESGHADRLSGNRLVRETSVRESDCLGNVRYPWQHIDSDTDARLCWQHPDSDSDARLCWQWQDADKTVALWGDIAGAVSTCQTPTDTCRRPRWHRHRQRLSTVTVTRAEQTVDSIQRPQLLTTTFTTHYQP